MNYRRALVVDDSKVARLTLKKKLEVHGVVADFAESAQEALDYLAHDRPDIIFMDHLMPDMDGFEATRRIKSVPATQDIPIIIVSGRDDEAFIGQARASGASHAIGKPPAPGVLEAILRSPPGAVTEPLPGAPAEVALQPSAVEGSAPRVPPVMDQAAVHALVERMLGEFVEHLRADIVAELRAQVETEFEDGRKALQEGRSRLDEMVAGMADLQRGAVDAETLGQQVNAVEQRLLALESEPVGAALDPDTVRETVEQHLAPRLDGLQASIERQEPLLESLREELATRIGEQQAQVTQSAGELGRRLDTLSDDLNHLSDGTLSSEAGHDQRFEVLEKRLVAIESAEPTPAPDLDAMLAAMEERVAPRLADMEIKFQALEAGLAAHSGRLQVQIDEERERLMARHEQERAQLAAGLDQQQSRLAACDDGWTQRFRTLEQRLEEMARVGIDDGVQRVLEQRIAQMREVIGAALQADYPGRAAAWLAETPREVAVIEHDAGTTGLSGGLLEAIEAKVSDLYDQLSGPQLRRLITDAVDSAQTATGADPELEERMEARLSGRWDDRLRTELVRLESKVKMLTAMLAVGGVGVLVAIAVALLR